jgi:hypothetical protein
MVHGQQPINEEPSKDIGPTSQVNHISIKTWNALLA